MSEPAIHWPAEFDPARTPIHVVNRIDLTTPADAVWARLIHAPAWPQWYANASKVKIEGGEGELFAGAGFTWRTFGVDLVSEVLEFVPGERIAWDARARGLAAYHAWLIVPTATGCHVVTEETQHGLVARLGRLIFPGRMERWHQTWLEGLAG
jgi:hypothetical protein